MSVVLPSGRIFKFIPQADFLLRTLSTPYLWFASVHDFNDPFETVGCYKPPPFSNDDYLRYLSLIVQHEIYVNKTDLSDEKYQILQSLTCRELYDHLSANYLTLQKKILDDVYLKRIGVCSFVRLMEPTKSCQEGRDYQAHLNRLMWSHYAKGLSGVCLEFDAEVLFKSLMAQNPDFDISGSDIEYSEERPTINTFDFMQSVYSNPPNSGLGNAMDIINQKSTKSSVWEYENEIRFRISRSDGVGTAVNQALRYDPIAIKGVYLGQRLPTEEKMEIKNILNALGVCDLREVVLHEQSFKLIDIPLVI
jgi:hypothetical protein